MYENDSNTAETNPAKKKIETMTKEEMLAWYTKDGANIHDLFEQGKEPETKYYPKISLWELLRRFLAFIMGRGGQENQTLADLVKPIPYAEGFRAGKEGIQLTNEDIAKLTSDQKASITVKMGNSIVQLKMNQCVGGILPDGRPINASDFNFPMQLPPNTTLIFNSLVITRPNGEIKELYFNRIKELAQMETRLAAQGSSLQEVRSQSPEPPQETPPSSSEASKETAKEEKKEEKEDFQRQLRATTKRNKETKSAQKTSSISTDEKNNTIFANQESQTQKQEQVINPEVQMQQVASQNKG